MRIPAFLSVVSANVLIGSASPVALGAVQRDKHDLASILTQAADVPAVEENGLLSDVIGAIVDGVIVDGKSNLTDIVASLALAIYISESLKLVILYRTAVPAGLTRYFSFGKLVDAVREADAVWINIPGPSLADAQVNAEYVAYAINYISAVSDSNVAVLSWSQGGLNVQWSFKYWPSTRDVVDDFIAISPDFRDPQIYETDFIEVLRANGEGSVYVTTTTLYSSFNEIVQPQSGDNASAILNDAQGEGVTDNHAQTVCAGRPGSGVYLHEGMWALAVDALRHDGPGDVSRTDIENVCADLIAPQLGVDDLLGSEGLLLVAVAELMAFNQKPSGEGPIASYARNQ
ncbi:hypothetical protein BDV10DRAFT_182351 [Aspergillus recurvatus]